jgi:hypothetical protein
VRAVRRVITPEILRAALAEVRVVPTPTRPLARVILDAIEDGYAKLELATPIRSMTASRLERMVVGRS